LHLAESTRQIESGGIHEPDCIWRNPREYHAPDAIWRYVIASGERAETTNRPNHPWGGFFWCILQRGQRSVTFASCYFEPAQFDC
jgi:hypothetical protein